MAPMKSRLLAVVVRVTAAIEVPRAKAEPRVMVREPVASWISSQMQRCPSVGLVGLPRVRLPAQGHRKWVPRLASVAIVAGIGQGDRSPGDHLRRRRA
jgi:hypothetical protein